MSDNTQERDRKLEGDIHALLMDFRNACLEARSELHQTGDANTTTNKIIVAQARADIAIQALIKSQTNQAVVEALDRVDTEVIGEDDFARTSPSRENRNNLKKEQRQTLATLRKELTQEVQTDE